MIFETKTTKKIQPRLGKWSSLFLVTLIIFSGLFSFTSKQAAAAEPSNTTTGTQSNTATTPVTATQPQTVSPCNPNRNLPSSYQPQSGLSIYNCLARDAGFAGETGGTTYTMWYILLLDGKKLPTVQGSNQCDKCTVTWLLNGKEQTRNKDQVEYGKLNTMSVDKTIGAIVNINGQVLSVNKDAQKVDEVTKTEDMAKKESGSIIGFIQTIIQAVVLLITGILQKITQWVIIPLIKVVLDIKPHDPSFAAMILGGWVFVRNIVNIFFIIAMLIIALATLFRASSFNAKHLIPQLVINALLINFSLVIAQLILGVADTLQAQFIPNNSEVLSNLSYQLMVKPNLSLYVAPFTGSLAGIVSSVFYLFLAFASFLMFGALAVLLLIRVVALWIILLLSPLYFGLRTFAHETDFAHHATQKISSNFFKWAFFTPVIGFFLHIIASMANIQAEYISKVTEASITKNASASFGQFVSLVVANGVILLLMYIALEVSQEISPKNVGGVFKKLEHWSVKPFEFAGEGMKDAAQRARYNTAANMTEKYGRDEKGEMRTDWRGKLARGATNALAPELAAKKYMHDIEEKNEEAKKLAKVQTETISKFRKSEGFVDLKGVSGIHKKEHEEELNRVLKDSPKKAHETLEKLKTRLADEPKNEALLKEIELRVEALAKTNKIESVVRNANAGEFDRGKLETYIRNAAGGNAELEKKLRKKVAEGAKASGSMAGIAIDKPGISNDDLDKEMADVINNMEPTEIRKAKMYGVDPSTFGRVKSALENQIRNSGVRDENLADNQKQFLGRGKATYTAAGPTMPT